ncbi:hypothetical protein Ahy_B08g091690 [Arachis hypogaea]|uniref:Aminotransferase-like plant mobile domain-containing protein n=1 Tax=Arachis hypogaea TaxID=3818 RepID=A0A444Y2M4_ARAHY|nr:hypothetical protein Ahy_B08g091690 [Arachis hypogaea]
MEGEAVSVQRYKKLWEFRFSQKRFVTGYGVVNYKSGIFVHWKYLPLLRDFSQILKFSWGSAFLAHMYRSLCQTSRYDCKDMDGPMALLLVRRLDDLPLDAFVWDTYSPNRVAPHVIPFDINNGANLLSATVPLICFEAVEWHPTDRIRRQFGFHQDPPVEAIKLGVSHNIVLTSPKNKNWGVEHAVNMLTTFNHPTRTWTGILVNSMITCGSLSLLSKRKNINKNNHISKNNNLSKNNHLNNKDHLGKNNDWVPNHLGRTLYRCQWLTLFPDDCLWMRGIHREPIMSILGEELLLIQLGVSTEGLDVAKV